MKGCDIGGGRQGLALARAVTPPSRRSFRWTKT